MGWGPNRMAVSFVISQDFNFLKIGICTNRGKLSPGAANGC